MSRSAISCCSWHEIVAMEFKLVDKNGDGQVALDELERFVSGMHETEAVFLKLMKKVDKDGDQHASSMTFKLDVRENICCKYTKFQLVYYFTKIPFLKLHWQTVGNHRQTLSVVERNKGAPVEYFDFT